jgi:hypothetical protein
MVTETDSTTAQATAEELTTREPTTEPTISAYPTSEEPTSSSPVPSNSITTGIASSTTDMVPVSSMPNDNTLPTDSTPGEPVSIDDGVRGGGSTPVSVVAAVVLAILVVITLTILISVLVAIVLSKKRSKSFNVTHTNLSLGIGNKLYGNNYLHVIDVHKYF